VDTAGKLSALLDVGQTVSAAPVVTAEGDLIMATENKLICYRADR
jgi:hypothetical protein